jgi:hypothetical protein
MAETREYNVDKILDDRLVKVRLLFGQQTVLTTGIHPVSAVASDFLH